MSTSSTRGGRAPLQIGGKSQERFDDSVALRVFSQLSSRSNLDTSNDRPACASGGVVVQKTPVRTSAQVMACFRRWFRCPALCQRAGLVLAQQRVPAPRDSLTLPHLQTRHQLWRGAPEHRSLRKTHSRQALAVWKRAQKSICNLGTLNRPPWDFVRDRVLDQYQPHLRLIQKLRFNRTLK